MKVLFVCREIPFYGISPIMLRQAEGLMNNNVVVDYFTVKGQGFSAYLKAASGLKKFLAARPGYDIIHAHYGLCGLSVTFAATTEKTVISFMGSELIGDPFPKHFLQNLVIRTINNRCIRKFNAIIVKSERMSKALKNKPHHVVPNGVSLEDFYPVDQKEARTKLGFDQTKKLVIFIADPPGRPEKNLKLAMSAIELLKDPSVELKTLHSMTKEQVNLSYSAADVLLLTSVHEGSPNVIKEAMACGCPIVTTDVGDVKKNIGDLEGCFITTFEPADVANKIRLALSSKRTDGRQRLVQIGLDSRSSTQRLIEVYKSLLN